MDYSLAPKLNTKNLLVFTDMDGTLLDHHTYSFDAASKTLADLENRNTLVVPNTSKTFAELQVLRKDIGLNSPFIVENGAGIYIPKNDVFDEQFASNYDLQSKGDYWLQELARPRKTFIDLLSKLPDKYIGQYKAFHQMSIKEVCKYTDLPVASARLSMQREYGEPIKWLGDIQSKSNFIQALKDLGGHVVEGGRFIHFADKTDKAQAMIVFKSIIESNSKKTYSTLALGDGNNDLSMLEQADISICIKSPINPRLELQKSQNVFFTELEGPSGWAESIQNLIINPKGTS